MAGGCSFWEAGANNKFQLQTLPMTPERQNRPRTPVPYLTSDFHLTQAQFSPDGHWVAYVSDESGKDEVYVQPFPLEAGKGRWTLSNGGGVMPRWRRDGRELFYVSSGPGGGIMAVDVAYSPSFRTSVPKAIIHPDSFSLVPDGFTWDVTADGKRFLVTTTASTPEAGGPRSPLTVVLNWPALLKK